jgi:hypothetical protein
MIVLFVMVAVVAAPLVAFVPLTTMPPFWFAEIMLPSIVPVPPFVK